MILCFLRKLARRLRQAIAALICGRHHHRHHRHPRRLVFLSPKGIPMTTTTLPFSKVETVPVIALDQNGAPIALPAVLVFSSSDDTIGTATVGADGASVVLTALVEDGAFSVTATSGSLTATLDVTISGGVVTPVATTLLFDVANATFADKSST